MLNVMSGRRDLVVLLTGRMVSTFGDGVALVALTLRLQADGAHPYDVALLAGAALPALLLARPVGRLVDTNDSRRLLVVSGLVQLLATVPLIVVHSLVPMLALIAVLTTAGSVAGSTWSALLPRVVGEDRLAKAVSTQSSLNVLALVGAPAAGGLLAGAFGTGLPLVVDAATFVVVTIAAGVIRTRRAPEQLAPEADEPAAAAGGFALLRADRVLAPLLAGVALVVLLVGMADVVLVFLVRETLHAGGVWYGVAEASWMAGMVLGSVGAGRLRAEHARVRATIVGMAVVCAAIAGFAAAPSVAILVPLSIIGGIGNGYAGACVSTLLMTRTPDRARGRVSAAAGAILGGAQGTSLLAGGATAVVLTPRQIYAVAGLLGLAAAGVVAVAQPRQAASAERGDPTRRPVDRCEPADAVPR